MANGIAPLDLMSAALDTNAKLVRGLADAGVSISHFRYPIDDKQARSNLAAYLIAGCPQVPPEVLAPSPVLSKNRYGHHLLTFTALDLPGREEVLRLQAAGWRVHGFARSCFNNDNHDGYDATHRLESGKRYTVALLPAELALAATPSMAQLAESFGYKRPFAGAAPRIRESLSDVQLRKLGLRYIAVPHTPIPDRTGTPCIFFVSQYGKGKWIEMADSRPGRESFEDEGAFAFFVDI